MQHDGASSPRPEVVVVSTAEHWFSFKSLLQNSAGNHPQCTFSSLGSNQVCELTVEHHTLRLHYAELKQDTSEENIAQEIDGCFRSCKGGSCIFLLLIEGGFYSKRERRMIEILQAHFGAEALKFLVVLSLENLKIADTLDDSLMELINTCDGRYCRVCSVGAGEGLRPLFEMVDLTLIEHGGEGYSHAMLAEAKKRSTEDSSMMMLKQKVQEAEEKGQAFEELVKFQEDRRAREIEALKVKHAEERKREISERKKHESKRESLEEAVVSHRAMLQRQMSEGNDAKKTSVVLLGLSGCGKTSALNLILERAGGHYSVSEARPEAPQPTLACDRKKVFAEGRQLVLVDTPEMWDEDGMENLELVKDCLALALPGPHVFLLVLQVGRFTQGECNMLGHLQKIFGRDFVERTIILFVRFDGGGRRPQRISDFVAGAHATLQGVVQKCGSRYYELNVTRSQNALSYPQVKELLSAINKLAAAYGGRAYGTRRFSVQELQGRKRQIEGQKEGALEGNYLLRK